MTVDTLKNRKPLIPPKNTNKVLLHSCCAPCSGEVMEAMTASGVDYAIFFYNPNIHPREEYEVRKEENIRYAREHNIEMVDADYNVDNWVERVEGLEYEPEGCRRGTACIDMRVERTAVYACDHGARTCGRALGDVSR